MKVCFEVVTTVEIFYVIRILHCEHFEFLKSTFERAICITVTIEPDRFYNGNNRAGQLL